MLDLLPSAASGFFGETREEASKRSLRIPPHPESTVWRGLCSPDDLGLKGSLPSCGGAGGQQWRLPKLMAPGALSHQPSKAPKEILGGLSCPHLPVLMVFLVSSVLAQINSALLLNTTRMPSPRWPTPGNANSCQEALFFYTFCGNKK